jgi:hypothetical protein
MNIIVLPYYLKKIGWIILGLCIPMLFLLKELGMGKEKSLQLVSLIGLIGFLMTILSAHKNENEAYRNLRTVLLAKSFLNVILLTFVNNLFELLGLFTLDGGSIFASPIGLIYFAGVMYYFFYWMQSENLRK